MIFKVKKSIALLCSSFFNFFAEFADFYRSKVFHKLLSRKFYNSADLKNFESSHCSFHKGSLLLEIAIGISILGIISGFVLTKGMISIKTMQERKTRANIEIVTSALAAYLSQNYHLPLPLHTENPSDEEFGSESTSASSANIKIAVGKVPFNKLGISERDTVDGKGRPLLYIVNPELTQNFRRIYIDEKEGFITDNYFCSGSLNDYIIVRENNRVLSDAEIIDNTDDMVAFVIDTQDNSPVMRGGKIIIKPSIYTKWIRRDFFLMYYLKNKSCNSLEGSKYPAEPEEVEIVL